MKLKLPFWLSGYELSKLKDAAEAFWVELLALLEFCHKQLDEENCHLVVLNLLAWQRGVERLKDEPIDIFRLRVKYALVNAKDAGNAAGMKRIFKRLGLGNDIRIDERITGQDFDIVHLVLDDSLLASNVDLLLQIIQKYGRTCRRYRLEISNSMNINFACWEFGNTWTTDNMSI